MSRIRIHAGIAALAAALLVTPVAISAQDTTATTRTDDRDNDEGFDKGLLGLLGLIGLAGLRKKPDQHVHVERDVHTTPGTTGGTPPGARRP